MILEKVVIDCQTPKCSWNINRKYFIIKCTINKSDQDFLECKNKAWDLAKKVNPRKANDSVSDREKEMVLIDSLGGVLAEYGKIVNFTEFKESSNQVDLLLDNNKSIEVRSSFPRNGIKFAICNETYNFKNICKYDNLYKPSEQDKDFFAATLFETQKNNLLISNKVVFYLIGGSTRKMMENPKISFEADLEPEDDFYKYKTKYKVIKISNALDILGFEDYMMNMGYNKR